MTKIIIADDHQIVIDGLKALFEEEKALQIIGEAANGLLLMKKIPSLQPDLVIMDIGMPVMDGIEASSIIKKKYPTIKILVLTTYADKYKIKKILKIGVDGYLLKDSGKSKLLEAIHTIMEGQTYYDKRVTEIMMNDHRAPKTKYQTAATLTKREKEVIKLIVEGMNTSEIAAALFLSSLTIETHRKNIFTKLGINKVASLVRYAIEEGLVD